MLWIKWFKITKEIRFNVYCRSDLRSGTFDKTWRGKGKLLALWSCSAQEFSLKQLWQMIFTISGKKNIINVLIVRLFYLLFDQNLFSYVLWQFILAEVWDNKSYLQEECYYINITIFEECYYTILYVFYPNQSLTVYHAQFHQLLFIELQLQLLNHPCCLFIQPLQVFFILWCNTNIDANTE